MTRVKNTFIYENKTNYKIIFNINFGGIIMTTTKTGTGYVITADGIRMSYDEYMDMIMSERN